MKRASGGDGRRHGEAEEKAKREKAGKLTRRASGLLPCTRNKGMGRKERRRALNIQTSIDSQSARPEAEKCSHS